MARRTKAEADETRTKLLDAAEEVFFEKGVSRTSLGDIAQRAGATRGAVYWHFKDKMDVFVSMLGRICLPFEEICDDRYGDLLPLERIRHSILCVFESLDEDERRRKVFETALFKMEYVGELADVRLQHIESSGFARKICARPGGCSAGAVRAVVGIPEEAALGLHSLCGSYTWLGIDGRSFSLVKVGSMSVDVYLSGLGFQVNL
jgi:TetR/AcrR family acrAB operon transcriptional repressor